METGTRTTAHCESAEVEQLKRANEAVSEALRSIEEMAWLDIDPTNGPISACQVLVGKIRDAGDVSHVGVFMMDPATFEFRLKLTVPDFMAESVQGEFEHQLAAGMIGWVVRERRLVAVPPAGLDSEDRPWESVIIFPISTMRQVWGLAVCFSPHPHDKIPQNVLRLLSIVANHIGMTVENCSLLSALAEQNRTLEQKVAERSAELIAKKQDLETVCEELRRTDAAKDDFLSLVAHEIRTPLTSILSLSEFLGEEGLAAQDVRDFADSIKGEATRLHLLVNDVLDLAKMESGKMAYRYAEDDLNAIASICLSNMRPAAARKKISLRFQSAKIPRLVFARDRIQQVIVNMLSNAIKFSDEGGEVIVRTEDAGEGVRLSVQDFGAGIAARDIPRVFNKFEQVQDLKHRHEGTGFGMPISRNIVEAGHKGRMWVESEGRGKGATFYFILTKERIAGQPPVAPPFHKTGERS